ncbi:MAG: TIR domain-containing protein [Gammaproteobacteria bacterium AqS3]|nr:TIR domain-containing protein [Gammaproteobacteria bacterium AqS3]
MGYKVFVSYKHEDTNVHPLDNASSAKGLAQTVRASTAFSNGLWHPPRSQGLYVPDEMRERLRADNSSVTARAYVDELIASLEETGNIYKGEEDDEDISHLSEDQIKSKLADKLYDTSITVVLISRGMKEFLAKEKKQWIPWEVSYSLKEITRKEQTSRTNAVLAVVLPDSNGSYDYYLEEKTCSYCHCTTLHTGFLFKILSENMFNAKEPKYNDCDNHGFQKVYIGESCYILSVKWDAFINNQNEYLNRAVKIKENIDDYNITKEIPDD